MLSHPEAAGSAHHGSCGVDGLQGELGGPFAVGRKGGPFRGSANPDPPGQYLPFLSSAGKER